MCTKSLKPAYYAIATPASENPRHAGSASSSSLDLLEATVLTATAAGGGRGEGVTGVVGAEEGLGGVRSALSDPAKEGSRAGARVGVGMALKASTDAVFRTFGAGGPIVILEVLGDLLDAAGFGPEGPSFPTLVTT